MLDGERSALDGQADRERCKRNVGQCRIKTVRRIFVAIGLDFFLCILQGSAEPRLTHG